MPPLIPIDGPHSLLTYAVNKRYGQLRETNPELFPKFAPEHTILCFSDYSGQNSKKQTKVKTYSTLICAEEPLLDWNRNRIIFRERHKDFKNSFSYKSLRDKRLTGDKRHRLKVEEFFLFCNQVPGVVITASLPYGIDDRISGKTPVSDFFKDFDLGDDWGPTVADDLHRVVAYQIPFLYALTHPNQKVLYISDKDAITDGEFFPDVVYNLLDIFKTHPLDLVITDSNSVETPEHLKERMYSDLLTIPDLMAGFSYAEARMILGKEKALPYKASLIDRFFNTQFFPLKKHSFRYEAVPNGMPNFHTTLLPNTPRFALER